MPGYDGCGLVGCPPTHQHAVLVLPLASRLIRDCHLSRSCPQLGVLLLPALEAAYQRHRHRGFRAAPVGSGDGSAARPPLGPAAGVGPRTRVRFVAWRQDMAQEAILDAGADVLTVPLPVAYPLPPRHYAAKADLPWAVDGNFEGVDSFGEQATMLAFGFHIMPIGTLLAHTLSNSLTNRLRVTLCCLPPPS